MGYIKIDDHETYLDEIVGFVVAALGLIFQLYYGFRVPFPFNVLLFPINIAEYFLSWVVGAK